MPCYDFPRPALTVDAVVLMLGTPRTILLIQRRQDPFQGAWALPGGFAEENEGLETAARRELQEETGLAVDRLFSVGAFGAPGRDPRGWTVSVAFLAPMAPEAARSAAAASDAAEVGWFEVDAVPELRLAFDHDEIIYEALDKARALGFLTGA